MRIIQALKTVTKTQVKDGAGITDKKFDDLFGNGGGLFVRNRAVIVANGFGIHQEPGYSLTDFGKELLDYYEWSLRTSKEREFFNK